MEHIPLDYKPFALTRLPGNDIPFYPEIKTTYYAINNEIETVIVKYEFETMMRIKAKDGLYRDIMCRETWEEHFQLADATMENTLQATITAMTRAVNRFGLNKELYIADNHEVSPYQMDEAKRLTYLNTF